MYSGTQKHCPSPIFLVRRWSLSSRKQKKKWWLLYYPWIWNFGCSAHGSLNIQRVEHHDVWHFDLLKVWSHIAILETQHMFAKQNLASNSYATKTCPYDLLVSIHLSIYKSITRPLCCWFGLAWMRYNVSRTNKHLISTMPCLPEILLKSSTKCKLNASYRK